MEKSHFTGRGNVMFNVKTVAQAVAWLLSKSDEPLDRMKVQRLLYLADRECMNQTGFPITDDVYYHMKYGPVLSRTLDLMKGNDTDEYWDKWIMTKGSNDNYQLISVRAGNFNREALDHLSDFELGILDGIWNDFGCMDRFELSRYTYTLPEYVQTDTRENLSHVDILLALGYEKKAAQDQASDKAVYHSVPG